MSPDAPHENQHPGLVLLAWMESIPASQRAGLAHLYLMCTSRDLTPFFMEPEEALEAFRTHLLKGDMPVRVASRLIATGAVMDLVVTCLARKGPEARALAKISKVVDIEGPLWQKTMDSWVSFRRERFSATHMAQWFVNEEKTEKGS